MSTPNGIVGRLVKYTLDTGKASEVKLPASGTVDINCPDFRTDQCIVFTTSWIQPTTLYDFDAEKETFTKSIFNTASRIRDSRTSSPRRSRFPDMTGR